MLFPATSKVPHSHSKRFFNPPPHLHARIMKVLIACEYSGRVREAFNRLGHEAWSCDLIPSEDGSLFHWKEDWRRAFERQAWDLVIAFPPCTDLCVSGARHFAQKKADGRQQASIDFFMEFTRLPCKWAIENPVGIMSTYYRKPDQVIQPWMFGHGETKATCLWLHGLPKLTPTDIVEGREARVHRLPPGPNRWKERSRTYQGIADAMASQWGKDHESKSHHARSQLPPHA